MTGVWYIFLDGKVEGPKDSEEIRELLWTGDISNADPIFKMGGNRWHLIREIQEFQPKELQALSGHLAAGPAAQPGEESNAADEEWVVLSKRVRDNRARYLPVGPFSQRQIFEKIHTGELKYTDYLWKEGWSGWVKISEVPEFKTEQERAAEPGPMDKILSASPAAELAQVSRVKLNPTTPPMTPPIKQGPPPQTVPQPVVLRQETPPAESVTPSLAQEFLRPQPQFQGPMDDEKTDTYVPAVEKSEPLLQKKAAAFEERPEDDRARATDLTPFIKPRKSKTRLAVLMFTLSGLFLGLHFLLVESPQSPLNQHFAPSRPPLQAKQGEETNPGKPSLNDKTKGAPAEPLSEKTKEQLAKINAPQPPSVKIVALKLDSAQPQLAIETNAEPNEMIKVEVSGRSGEILDVLSFKNQADIKRSNYELPILDLSQWHLPKGTYRVTARLKEAVDEREIFVGQKDQAFERKLAEHRKQIAYRQQLEKLTTVRVVQDLSGQVKELKSLLERSSKKSNQRADKKSYQAWLHKQGEIVAKLKRLQEVESSQALAYPELLAETLEFANQVESKGASLAQSASEGRTVASDIEPVDPALKQKVDGLYKQVKSISSQSD